MHTASKRWRVYVLALLAGLMLAVVGVAAGCGSTKTARKTAAVTSDSTSGTAMLLSVQLPPGTPTGEMVLYGHIKSLALSQASRSDGGEPGASVLQSRFGQEPDSRSPSDTSLTCASEFTDA